MSMDFVRSTVSLTPLKKFDMISDSTLCRARRGLRRFKYSNLSQQIALRNSSCEWRSEKTRINHGVSRALKLVVPCESLFLHGFDNYRMVATVDCEPFNANQKQL